MYYQQQPSFYLRFFRARGSRRPVTSTVHVTSLHPNIQRFLGARFVLGLYFFALCLPVVGMSDLEDELARVVAG